MSSRQCKKVNWNRPAARAVAACLLAAATFVVPGCVPKKYSWNQKLTLEIEAGGEIYKGSSVIEVTWWEDPYNKTIGLPVASSMRGEAAFVDIPGKGTVFALLKSEHDRGDPTRVAFWALGYAPEPGFKNESFRTLSKSQGRAAELTPDQYPMLVTFGDLNDPLTAKEVDPRDLAATLGQGVRLKAISIEITPDQRSLAIDQRLAWLADLKGGYLHGGSTSRNSPLGLHAGDFAQGGNK